MKCPHCLLQVHPQTVIVNLLHDIEGEWAVRTLLCPACRKCTFELLTGKFHMSGDGRSNRTVVTGEKIYLRYPKASGRPPCPPEVPVNIAQDYTEACLVLADSPKASAALSRRCLQHLLAEKANATQKNLVDQIEFVLQSGIPSHLTPLLDAVRVTGNFAAHPIKSTATGQLVEVEPHEAETNLDVLESLFDFYCVQPAINQKKRHELNAKLMAANKPSLK